MNIAMDPTAILPNPYGRIQPSGTVFDVDESLLYTDQVDIRYNLSETGTLSDENGVYQYTYRFDIRVGCRVGSGTDFVVISQK